MCIESEARISRFDDTWNSRARRNWFCLICIVAFATSAGCNSENTPTPDKLSSANNDSTVIPISDSNSKFENSRTTQKELSEHGESRSQKLVTEFDRPPIKIVDRFISSDDIAADKTSNRNSQNNAVGSTSGFAKHVVDDAVRQKLKTKSRQFTATAVELIKQGKIDEALRQLQQALLADKSNVEAIFRTMSVLDDRGQQKIQSGNLKDGYADLITAGIFAREIVGQPVMKQLPQKQRTWIANALYNAACAQSLLNKKQLAMESLTLAFQSGFDRPQLLQNDPDLDPLRTLPDFQKLARKYGQPNTSNRQ